MKEEIKKSLCGLLSVALGIFLGFLFGVNNGRNVEIRYLIQSNKILPVIETNTVVSTNYNWNKY